MSKTSDSDLTSSFLKSAGISPRTTIPQPNIEAVLLDIKKRAKIRFLIWGPGPSVGDLYKKRCEIRDRLTDFGHEAQFSENVVLSDKLQCGGLNLTLSEFVQAKSYDYILCLMASLGSIGEVHDFAKYKNIASKMMICIDNKHNDGYSANGTLRIFQGHNGKVDWYIYPADLVECNLATRVLNHAQMVAEAKEWELATGGTQ